MSTVLYPALQPPPAQTLPYAGVPGHIGEVEYPLSEPSDRSLRIESLLESIEHPTVRETVRKVFSDLIGLLECLKLVGSSSLPMDQWQEALEVFEIIHVDARSVVSSIQEAMQTAGIDDALFDTLDGITFALNHDLQRVFECELKGAADNPRAVLVIGKLIHSHGTLSNCLQQSIVALAQVFRPAFSGALFFNNSDVRLQESLLLCRDLSELIRDVVNCEARLDGPSRTLIIDRVMRFRDGTMQFLMYKDWEEYERFGDEIVLSIADPERLGSVLHSFRCYLETLVGQVNLRAVLATESENSLHYQVCA